MIFCRLPHRRAHPPLPPSLGSSLITLLDPSACGWAHYPSTLPLLLPKTVPPFISPADALPVTTPHLITGT